MSLRFGSSTFLLLAACGQLLIGARAADCSATQLCEGNLCCSQYGYCGTTAAYCAADTCLSQCWDSPSVAPTYAPTSSPSDFNGGSSGLSGTATFTTYTSYAECCYDTTADQTECEDFNACEYQGDFAAIGHKSLDYVMSNNLVSFYDDNDPSGSTFLKNYGGRYIRLTKGDVSFTALIADTCGNSDCDGCCAENAQEHGTGYLLDMEYWTVMRNFGDIDEADGTISFEML